MSEPHPNEAIVVKEGQHAPDFTLLNTGGQRYVLSAAVAAGPVVLVFYRGDW